MAKRVLLETRDLLFRSKLGAVVAAAGADVSRDEAGTPFGITIDGQSTQDGTVTVRDRDTLKQIRVAADQLAEYLAERLKG